MWRLLQMGWGLGMGCDTASSTVAPGVLDVCLPDGAQEADLSLELVGDVVAIDAGGGACQRTVTLEDADGTQHTVGVSVRDAAGADVSQVIDLSVGQTITVSAQRRLVFGSVEGLVITDEGGLVLAADEGTWGGALSDDTALGMQVDFGETPVQRTATDCVTTEIFEVVFTGDEAVTLVPFSTGEVVVDGALLTAYAVDASQLGPGTTCEVSDQTDTLSWLVVR